MNQEWDDEEFIPATEFEERQTLLVLGLLLLDQTDETMEGILTALGTQVEVEEMLNFLAQFDEEEAYKLTEQQLIDQVVAIHKRYM